MKIYNILLISFLVSMFFITLGSAYSESLLWIENFNDLNATRWANYTTGSGTISIQNGFLNISDGGADRAFIYLRENLTGLNWSMEWNQTFTSSATQWRAGFWDFDFASDPLGGGIRGAYLDTNDAGGNTYLTLINSTGGSNVNQTFVGSPNITGTQNWKLTYLDTGLGYTELRRNGTVYLNMSGRLNGSQIGKIVFGGNPGTPNYVDYVKLYIVKETGVTLNSPYNSEIISSYNFNSSLEPGSIYNITNATIHIWNSSNSLIKNYTNVVTGSRKNDTNWTIVLPVGNYNWNVLGCFNQTSSIICQFSTLNSTFTIGSSINNSIYNSTSFETKTEGFVTNILVPSNSSISSVNLFYNGTSYSGSYTLVGAYYKLSKSLDLPLVTGTQNWFWSINYQEGYQQNLSSNSQTVSGLNFTQCTTAPLNVPFLNITFKNETTLQSSITSILSGSFTYWLGSGSINKTLSYSNTTQHSSFAFCSNATSNTLNVLSSLSYSNSESPQRNFNKLFSLTNATTNQTLWLLPSSQGQYVTFQVVSASNQPINGVNVTVSRSGYGTIETKLTDSAGSATFWLNPNNQYDFTFDKVGYSVYSTSLSPTSTSYTVNLASGTTTDNVPQTFAGIDYNFGPSSSYLFNQTTYTFNFTLTSDYYDVEEFGFILLNASGSVVDSDSASTNGGTVSVSYNTGNNSVVSMNAYWIIDGNITNVTRYWTVFDYSRSENSLKEWFDRISYYLSDSSDSDGIFGLKSGFNLNFATFLIIFIITGLAGYSLGLYALPFGTTILASMVLLMSWFASQVGLLVFDQVNLYLGLLFLVVVALAVREVRQ